MDIQSTLYFQIAADVFLCLSMAALVLYLRKNGNRGKRSVIDGESVGQLKKLLAESQKDAERFFQSFDDCCRTFRELVADLETREKRLRALIEEAKKQQERSAPRGNEDAEEKNGDHRYADILGWLGEGVAVEEIAKRTGTTSGEILLIADLEKARQSSAGAGE